MDGEGKFRQCVRAFEQLYMQDNDLQQREVRDEDKLAGDRQSLAQRQKLFVTLFATVGLLGVDQQFDVSKEIKMGDLGGFADECLRKKREIERLLGIPVRSDVHANPTQQLSALLRIFGLSLKKTGTKSTGGDKCYIYALDGEKLAQVQRIVERRSAEAMMSDSVIMLKDRKIDPVWLAAHKAKQIADANNPVEMAA